MTEKVTLYGPPDAVWAITMSIRSSVVTVLLATTGACGATPHASGARQEDMTATEHLEQARQDSLRAANSAYRYRPSSYNASPYSTPRYWSHWYPRYYYWDPALEYEALAC